MKRLNISILCGGGGSRLWPVSRQSTPKQFGSFGGGDPLLVSTVDRLSALREAFQVNHSIALGNHDHRFMVAEIVTQKDFDVVVEPLARDTAAAIGVLCQLLQARGEGDVPLVISPSDHRVKDVDGFVGSVAKAVELAEVQDIVLFGVKPNAPETGYGYLEVESSAAGELGQKVLTFHEKPTRETAEHYLANPNMFWNSGIFVVKPRAVLALMKQLNPELLQCVEGAVSKAEMDLNYLVLQREAFEKIRAKSFDYEVLEKAESVGFVPAGFDWTDLGSWQSVHQVSDKDELNTSTLGRSVSLGAKNSFIESSGPLVVAHEVEDIVAVATPDAVLVTRQDQSQNVKGIVTALKGTFAEIEEHKRMYRPWGWYESVVEGDRFQVKKICVKPGSKLSLQKHFHRSEHWVVVEGTALVQINDETSQLTENESTYIPLGAIHRLSNPGHIPLTIIEVQTGSYLGEDDIVRFDDVYGRSDEDGN